MTMAVVPGYIDRKVVREHAAPGHRFRLYLDWDGQPAKDARPWDATAALTTGDTMRLKALRARQHAVASALPSDLVLQVSTTSVSPFVTGLGNAHPLENGFAFLDPYGLPYLAGSGFKGVLRQSARELADTELSAWTHSTGWTPDLIDALFGPDVQDGNAEEDGTRCRGALCFWDVIPNVKASRLTVEVMTPHHTKYLSGTTDGTPPHDSEDPNPIRFLCVPPGSEFRFIITLNPQFVRSEHHGRLLNGHWKVLLQEALLHAFKWLGFGAKTAVGYGAMDATALETSLDATRNAQARAAQEAVEAERRAAEKAEQAAAADRAREAEIQRRAGLGLGGQLLEDFAKALARVPEPKTDANYQQFKQAVSALEKAAAAVSDQGERTRIADALEAAFEVRGWHAPGLKKDKRDKKEREHRDLVASFRGPGTP